MELQPRKHERNPGLCRHLHPFAAEIVGVELEAAQRPSLQQNVTDRRCAISIDGGQRHRIGFSDLRRYRLRQPLVEELKRVCRTLPFIETGGFVLMTHSGEIHGPSQADPPR